MPFYGSRSRGSGNKMRLIVALVIAAIGIITYLTSTEKNPVTGENQRVAMTVDQEKALGLEAAPQMARQMGGVEEGTPQAALVKEVGSRLVSSSVARKSPYIGNFNFHLLADGKTVNAFALPGGQIFITRGLLGRLKNEAQLAGVLGHEIGHVIHRHGAEHMAQGQLGQMLVTAVGVGASDDSGRGMTAALAAQMVNQMMQLKYSRGDELESDRFGLEAMIDSGYDPFGMLGVMEVLAEASKGRSQPKWLMSHPLPASRMEEIRNFLAERFPNGTPSNLSPGRRIALDALSPAPWSAPAPAVAHERSVSIAAFQ